MPDPTPAVAPPLDDEARDRRLRLLGWGLLALALVVLVARGLLLGKGAPTWAWAPLSFPTVVIAGIGVLGWRQRSRIRRSIFYVGGLVTAAVLSEAASLVAGLGDSRAARITAYAFTGAAIVLTLVTMIWAGPGQAGSPVIVQAAPAPATPRSGAPASGRRPAGGARKGGSRGGSRNGGSRGRKRR